MSEKAPPELVRALALFCAALINQPSHHKTSGSAVEVIEAARKFENYLQGGK